MNRNHFIKALFWYPARNTSYPILPYRGLGILIAICIFGLVVAFFVDRELGALARDGRIASKKWVDEDRRIDVENQKKIKSNAANPIFHSIGYIPPEPVQGRRRILVIGDSFIWGDGLTNMNMSWWRQLQWDLERRGYVNVDVVAAGLNGASTQDQYNWIVKGDLIDKVEPDAVIFGYVTNDPQMKDGHGNDLVKQMAVSIGSNGDYFESSLFAEVFPVLAYQLSTTMKNKRALSFGGDEAGYPYGIWEHKILEGENFRQYEELLSRLSNKFTEMIPPVFFVTTPNSPNKESFDGLYVPLKAAFTKVGIQLYDLLPPLVECCDGDVGQLAWGTNPVNGHPGPRLTHFYATHVLDILEEQYPEVLGVREASPKQYAPKINDWIPASTNPNLVGEGEWTFEWPEDESTLLNMPVEIPHIVLGFERPVSIRSVQLAAARDAEYRVWATVLDDNANYELRGYVPIGTGKGRVVKVLVPPEVSEKRITSLRIAMGALHSSEKKKSPLKVDRIVKMEGKAYYYPLPNMSDLADNNNSPMTSRLVMFEGGAHLPYPHSVHEHIKKIGHGRYSHWLDGLIFSSSDDSDPRSNGRTYAFHMGAEHGELIRLKIDFGKVAVRL